MIGVYLFLGVLLSSLLHIYVEARLDKATRDRGESVNHVLGASIYLIMALLLGVVVKDHTNILTGIMGAITSLSTRLLFFDQIYNTLTGKPRWYRGTVSWWDTKFYIPRIPRYAIFFLSTLFFVDRLYEIYGDVVSWTLAGMVALGAILGMIVHSVRQLNGRD